MTVIVRRTEQGGEGSGKIPSKPHSTAGPPGIIGGASYGAYDMGIMRLQGKAASALVGRLAGACLLTVGIACVCGISRADEVDDVLSARFKNADRVRRFSADYVVETSRTVSARAKSPNQMHYKINLARTSHAGLNQWRVTLEIMEPGNIAIRVEGDRTWIRNSKGEWIERYISSAYQKQLSAAIAPLLGSSLSDHRKNFEMRITKRNNPVFGPRIRTIEYVSRASNSLFGRMEEDVDDTGFALTTRLYGKDGAMHTCTSIKRHHVINGFPVIDEMVSSTETAVGRINTKTTCSNQSVDIE